MSSGWRGHFISAEGAGVTVEFVALMPAFVLLVFFVMEVAISLFTIGTAEKAAQLGVRLAVVSNWAASGAPTSNTLNAGGGAFGQSCTTAGGPCVPFSTITCTGSGPNCTCSGPTGVACSSSDFDFIASRMSGMLGLLKNHNEYITISYAYAGLGFAGGPVVPRVTVTLRNIPFNNLFSTTLADLIGNNSLTVLPTISATLTGEDLSDSYG